MATATAMKTSVKKCVCAASNLITCIPSCSISQMLANFSRVCDLKDCITVQKKKKRVLS